MNKVENQRASADNQQTDRKPIGFSSQVLASRTLGLGMISMLDGKNQGNTTFGSWGVVRGNDHSGFQSSATEVTLVDLSGIESARSGCCPSREALCCGLDGESVFGDELNCAEPTNFDGVEGIMNFDSFIGVDDLWADYKNPEQSANSDGIHYADPAISVEAGYEEGNGSAATNQDHDCKVNPVTSGTKNVVVRHNPKTTKVNFKDLRTQKGI